jgi:aspartate racemase
VVPVLHIARACVARLRQPPGAAVLVLATRGVQRSGLYRTALREAGLEPVEPDALAVQHDVDRCITQIKAGEPAAAAHSLSRVLRQAAGQGLSCVVLGCTELPLAARRCDPEGLTLVDSTRALALAAIEHALAEGVA